MRPSHKLLLVSAVAAELEHRYNFTDIDTYLQENGIDTQSWLGKSEQTDKWIFCLTAARIAEDQERL